MSGGWLVVLDRAGRDVKRFPLAEGLATLGSDPACDIRIMLPTVSPHHATVVVHANQTVVRNVCEDETLVNGRAVSVAALRHGDVIGVGGRRLRWDYADTAAPRLQAPQPALHARRRAARSARRGSGPAGATPRDAALQRALEMSHRASMPGSAGGKQVAIVQPQRRDTSHQIDRNPPRMSVQAKNRPRTSKGDVDASVIEADNENTKRKSNARVSPKNSLCNLQTTTKATLWIESRKTSPRKANKTQQQALRARRTTASAKKSTPLRLTVLRRAQSAHKTRVTKIEGPLKMDHTKQAAIRLMTGHTPKSHASSPSFVVKKPSPLRRTPRHSHATRADRTVTILEITDSDGQNSSLRTSNASRRSGQNSPKKSFATTSPRKSALKDPSAKRGARKTESIKFDLSNLENQSQDTDVLMVTDTTQQSYADSASDDDVTLRYSESPSPRRSIHSRSSRILHSSLGGQPAGPAAPRPTPAGPAAPHSAPPAPRPKRSSRGSLIVQKSLNETGASSYSRRSTKSASAYRTRTLSPRTGNDLESYSIVDLVSIDTDDSALSTSVYGSAGSTASTAFGTPRYSTGRKTRSTIDPALVGSSTPYVKGRSSIPRSRSDPSPHISRKASTNGKQSTIRSSRSRRSKSLSTPENTEDAKKHVTVNSTRISRASRSRSRLNDSDLLLLDDDEDSPRTSKRSTTRFSPQTAGNDSELTPTHSPAQHDGTCTPENRHSPEEPSTPVLSIQSLLDSSQSSFASQRPTRISRPSFNTNRKTIGGVTAPKARVGTKSKSMSFSARKTRLRLSSDSADMLNKNDDEIVTPKSAVKLVPEGVKNKHSTAKKPQSKRSIIDDLNESDIVKQLFNSPVKRKLSQSMTEFSRTQLFDDDVQSKRATRHTVALTGRTPDNSLLDHTESYTPEIFVSPISTPTRSPSLEGIKLMFAKTTPENDLRNVRGVKRLLRTPRSRRSIKNDLTDVSGVKNIFAKSPKNRLSDVRVKEVFALSPKNDLRRVTGVKALFQTTDKRKSPRNVLDDVRGVKQLYTKTPADDLRNVSGVKRTLRRQSPNNDLRDVRGLKRMFRRDKRNDLSDVSGVEELFNLSNYSSATASTRAESLFDQLVGKPQIRAVYSKTFSAKTANKAKGPRAKSLHASLDQITATDNDWLQQALNKRLQIKSYLDSLKTVNSSKAKADISKANKSKPLHASLDEVTDVDVLLEQELNKEQQISNYLESMRSVNESKVNKSKANRSRLNKSKAHVSKANVSRELQKLVTETVDGDAPLRSSRVRNSTIVQSNESDSDRKKSASELYSAHTLPIKKRSLVDAADMVALPLKKRALVHSTPAKGRALVHSTPAKGRALVHSTPAKGRALVHSTPVKGRALASMSESVLARVSPIRADDDARRTSVTSTQPKEMTEVRPKSTRGTRANTGNIETTNAPEIVKPSPKKTRGRTKVVSPKVKLASPVRGKATKTKKASPARAKVAGPVGKASPKKTKKSPAKELASPVSVKTTRSRRKDVSALESNTKKRGVTLVIAKKSPVISPKPRASRKRKEPEPSTTPKPSPKRTRATRKNESVKDDKPKTPKNTRAKVQKATVVVSKPSPQLKPRATRRGKADQSGETTRRTRITVAVHDERPESPKKSQVASNNTRAAEILPTKTRGRKIAASEFKHDPEVEQPQAKTKKSRNADESSNKKTRSNKQRKSVEEPKPMRTRRKKVESQESVESAPNTRGRRAAKPDSIAPGASTRKRKTTAPDNEIPPKVRKSKEVVEKGRKQATEVNTERNTRKKESKEEKANETLVKVTRGRKAAAVEPVKQPEQKTARGRKANIENVSANQVTGKRKRTATEPSPVKERKTRVTRGNNQPEGKPAGRTRRR